MGWRTASKSLCYALRRSGKDTRPRPALLTLVALIGVVGGYGCWWASVVPRGERKWSLGFYAVLFGAAWGLRALLKRQEENASPLSILDAPAPPRDDVEPRREQIVERLTIVASLLVRASGEQYLRGHEIPADAEIVTRQFHNRLLRERGLWEKLTAEELDLLIVADGSWSVDQINRAIEWSEQVRLLRWVLRLDSEIAPLAHFTLLDAGAAVDALERKDLPDAPLLDAWDVRAERETALAYAARCFAELMARGLAGENPEAAGWAEAMRTACLGESTDFVVQSRTVADLDEAELRLLFAMAAARERYAAWLVETLRSAASTAAS